MDTRIAIMSIIVENDAAVEQLNALLHSHGEYIIGRMGIPYRKRNVNLISIALDAPQDTISALAGKIMYWLLIVVSVPMVCGRIWGIGMFGWAVLMVICQQQLRKNKKKA